MRIAPMREKTMISKAASRYLPLIIAVSLTLSSTPILAQSRTYAGIFNSRWRTVGLHGHDQPICAPSSDLLPERRDPAAGAAVQQRRFRPGNLDNSIGFRAGTERDFRSFGRCRSWAGWKRR